MSWAFVCGCRNCASSRGRSTRAVTCGPICHRALSVEQCRRPQTWTPAAAARRTSPRPRNRNSRTTS
eukprot:536867-Pyramimonas_sp.AAC.1